jgi:hypothetical protein
MGHPIGYSLIEVLAWATRLRVYYGAVFEIKKEIRVYAFKASGLLGLSR